MNYNFQVNVVIAALPDLLSGAALSIALAIVSMAIGTALAVPMAIGSFRSFGLSSVLAKMWIEVARNTPCLAQIYAFYYGLGALGVFVPAWLSVAIALSFNNAGYLAEIFRGGLSGISENQYKAARSLGMGSVAAYRSVVFPQVFHNTFDAVSNQFIWALLNTSLGALIGMYDLSGVAMDYQSRTYKTFEFFIAIAIIYLVIAKTAIFLARFFRPKGMSHGL